MSVEDLNFYRDRRNCEPKGAPSVWLECEDGCHEQVFLPYRWEVCDVCEGRGTHVNPAIDCNGLTSEDFAQDPDFAEDYLSGAYDIPCNACGGRTTVPVVNEERCDPELLEAYRDQCASDAESRYWSAMERAMGA